jgi:hypothetical protein
LKLLFFTREPHPTYRADVSVLFGRYLPRFGIETDLVALEAAAAGGVGEWPAGRLYLCRRRGSKVANLVNPFVHAIATLVGARAEDYAAYQVRDNPLQAIIVMMAARMRGLPFFYWMSFPIPESSLALAKGGPKELGWIRYVYVTIKGHFGAWLLYRAVLPRADHVFVQSARMLEAVASRGIDRRKLTAVPMGVDLDAARPELIEPAEDARLAGRRVVIYLGAMERERRIDLLFEMLAVARPALPSVLLVLVGDSHDATQRNRLRTRMAELGVEDLVLWTGWLATREAWRYVRAAEVGISPIPRGPLLDVGSPTKALEYMALGIPVLANDQPDQAEVLAESGAGICAPLNPSAFADALREMLSSASRLAEWGSRGRPYVARHRSYEVIGSMLADTYRTLLAERAHKASS